jgi:hypothetical protein
VRSNDQHHHDARERGHHHQDRRCQRQDGQQRDQLNDAHVEAAAGGALAEIDADILSGEQRRRNDESRYEAATVVTRTRRPQAESLTSCLPDGPTNSPFAELG